MATPTQLSRDDIARLVTILKTAQDEADSLGETAERNRLAAAAAALEGWLREGGRRPPAVAEYAYLLAETDDGQAPPLSPTLSPGERERAGGSALSPTLSPGEREQAAESAPFDGPDAPLPEVEPEVVAEESEADRELRLELARVAHSLEAAESGSAGDLALARAQVSHLLARFPDAPAVVNLNAQVITQVNRRIAEALARGDKLRGDGNFEAARQEYETVQQLGGDDGRVAAAIVEMDRAAAAQTGDAQLNSLARELGERYDLQLLGRAVRAAEVLQDERRLPPQLADKLAEARQHWDESRRLQGEMTTFARFGDLKARRQAVQQIQDEMTRLARTVVFDSGRQEYIPAGAALAEAQRYYVEKSEELANYELNLVQGMLPAHPEAARQHLEKILETRPPVEGEQGDQYVSDFESGVAKRLLAKKLSDVGEMVAKLRLAEAEAARADAATDEVAVLKLLLGAYDFYPGMLRLSTRLELARNSAARRLATQMQALHNTARGALDAEQFADALAALQAADETTNAWPEETLPLDLRQLKATGVTLRAEVGLRRKLRADFDRLSGQIRADVLDPDNRKHGMGLYEEVIADSRFAVLAADLTELLVFVNQHKDTGEQLAELMRLTREEKWAEAQQLAKDIQESGKAGERAEEVERLSQQATRELEIAAALGDLAARRVPEARDRLNALWQRTSKGPVPDELVVIRKERLKDEEEMIDAAMNDKTMPPLFKEALVLAAQAEPAKQFAALRLFRHVAGDLGQTPDEGWPPYVLSSVTGQAISQATELRETLRANLLGNMTAAANQVRAGKAQPDDADVGTAADNARLLRQAALLDALDEKAAADELILFQGKADAALREKNGEWAEAVALWQKLDAEYPRRVVAETRRARIQLALRAADSHISRKQPDEALAVIDAALAAPGIGEAWELYLKRVDAYAALGDFAAGSVAIRRVEDLLPSDDTRRPQVDQQVQAKQRWLRREQVIVEAVQRAGKEREQGRYKEALTALSNARTALSNAQGDADTSRRLTDLRDAIYSEGSGRLLTQAQKFSVQAGQDSKTRAVVLLAELGEVERLAGVPDGQGRAAAELEPLKVEFDPIIRSTLTDAANFAPTAHPLDQAIEKAVDLSNRLQTFARVAPALAVQLGTLKGDLERDGPRISGMVDQLRRLRGLLDEVDDRNQDSEAGRQARALWDQAVVSGNFDRLETQRGLVVGTGLSLSPDAVAFQQRLDEWKEIRATLMGHIAAISHNFNSGKELPGPDGQPTPVENFGPALITLRTLKQMPATRSDGHIWQQLGQGDYARIHKLMDALLAVPDVFEGQTLRGWDHVEEATAIRLQEVNAWSVWEHAYNGHMQQAEALRAAAEALPPTVTMVEKRDAWARVDAALIEAQTALGEKVLLEGDEVAVRTRWAKLIDERATAARYAVEQWRVYLKNQMPPPGALAFPTAEEFNNASKTSRASLEAIVSRAQAVGHSNDDEKKRLEHFSRVLTELSSNPNDGLLSRLFNRS